MIYLTYKPDYFYQTPLQINGKKTTNDAILFQPTKIGKHTIDIQFSQFDRYGEEKKYSFQKEIMVVP